MVIGWWLVAGYPVWRWYAARVVDGSDEPWGLAALVGALFFVPWRRWSELLPRSAFALALATMGVAVAGMGILPALVRGGLWMLALIVLLGRNGPVLARAGLLLLSLPVLATAQFYLGYPLRVVTAASSVPLLRLAGFAVERQGTALRWAGETVLVDAPCSGVQMLWAGLFTACLLGALHGLGARATWRLWRRAALVVALANVVRCVLLFWVEVRVGQPPRWLHAGLGLALFAGALGAIAWLALRSREPTSVEGERAVVSATDRGRPSLLPWLVPTVGLILCGIGVAVGWAARSGSPGPTATAFPGWPSTFEGRSIQPLEISEREARFAVDFPGKVGAFTDGERTILLRWVARETRKLHPALHCLRGLGYAVQPGPVWRDAAGHKWGTTLAARGGNPRQVRERICDADGREWTDVSAWWWDAWRGTSSGPWWAATVFDE